MSKNAMNNAELIRIGKRLMWTFMVLVTIGVVLSSVQWRETSPSAGLQIDIKPLADGHNLITGEDIVKKIDRSFGFPLEGTPLNNIDIERLERILEEDPFIQRADAYVDAGSVINIRVSQREPVLRIIDNNGLNYYLDKDGVQIPPLEHFTARVLVATGSIPPYVPNFLEREKHLLQDVFYLAEQIRGDDFLAPLIEQIYVSNRGEMSLAPKVGDQKILLGRYVDMEEKLENLKIFYREGVPYEGWRKYKVYDLKYKGQVVAVK